MIAGMKIDRSVKPDTSANFSSKAYRVKQLTNREEITEQQHKSHSVLRRTSKPPSSM